MRLNSFVDCLLNLGGIYSSGVPGEGGGQCHLVSLNDSQMSPKLRAAAAPLRFTILVCSSERNGAAADPKQQLPGTLRMRFCSFSRKSRADRKTRTEAFSHDGGT